MTAVTSRPSPRHTPSMGVVSYLSDRLTNALTGAGTRHDARTANTYIPRILTQFEIDAAYRGSGLMRKIVQIPALDMVREWRTWTGVDDKQSSAIYDEEKRLGLRQKVRMVEVLRGLGGGALVLGLPGDPTTPAPTSISKGALSFVHVVSRWHLGFDQMQGNATQPGFGEPAMWQMSTTEGTKEVHPSRVIPFRADTVASLAMTTVSGPDAFWGESTVQQVLEAVQDSDDARGSFAALLRKAKLLRIGIPNLIDLASSPEGETQVMKRLAILATAESLHNATIYDSGDAIEGKGGEKIDDVSYSFVGAKDMINVYGEFVSAISDIPATRLLGRAPEGMNSSGESQQRDWQKKIRAQQTLELAPCLDRLDPYLIQSATGSRIVTASNDWAPLDTPSEKENAERFKIHAEAIEIMQRTATIPEEAFNRGAQSLMVEEGYMPDLESALAELDDDERYGAQLPEGLESNSEGGGPYLAEEERGRPAEVTPPPRRAANDAARTAVSGDFGLPEGE